MIKILHRLLAKNSSSKLLWISFFAAFALLLSAQRNVAHAQVNRDIDLQWIGEIFQISQNDPRWNQVRIGPFLSQPMGAKGCLLAALAMVANGKKLKPLELLEIPGWDPLLVSPPYVNREVFRVNGYEPTGNGDFSYWFSRLNRMRFWDRVFAPAYMTFKHYDRDEREGGFYVINKTLNSGNPAAKYYILGIKERGFPHALVVAGWDTRTKSYMILDPADCGWGGYWWCVPAVSHPIADKYGTDWRRKVQDIVEIDTSSFPFWSISNTIFSPVEMLVFDPNGKKTGFDPSIGGEVSEIPDASYSLYPIWSDPVGTEPQQDTPKLLNIQLPTDGTYRFQATGTGDGPFTLKFQAENKAGESNIDESISGTISNGQVLKYEMEYSSTGQASVAQVSNFTPEAKAGPDLNGLTGAPVQFDARQSFDVEGEIASYEWDFGDGTTGTGEQVSHAYAAPGTYTVTLKVTDAGGATATDTLQVVVILSQQRPVAVAGGPYFGYASSSEVPTHIEFNGSGSTDPNGETLTAIWDFGDGSPKVTTDPSTLSAQHSYASPGIYTATLTVNDGIEDSLPVTTTVEVLPALHAQTISATPECGQTGDAVEVGGFDGGFYNSRLRRGGWNFQNGPVEVNDVPIWLNWSEESREALRLKPSLPDLSFHRTATVPDDATAGSRRIEIVEGESTEFTIPCPPYVDPFPIAHAGGPIYTGTAGTPVSFDGSESTDPEGRALTYYWNFADGAFGTEEKPQHTYSEPGEYYVQLVVSNGELFSQPAIGSPSFAKVIITEGSPSLSCSNARPSIATLWPPNHRFVQVKIEGVTSSADGPVTITITSIRQDEPVDAPGSGNTSPDGRGIGTDTAEVRAERVGTGNGRVYHIGFEAADGQGGACSGVVKVGSAPHDQGAVSTAIDDGALYDSTQAIR